MSSRQSLFKHSGSTLDRLRQQRIHESDLIRQEKRERELNRIREPDNAANQMNDEPEYPPGSSIFDQEIINDLFSQQEAMRIKALRYYIAQIVKQEPDTATAMTEDLISLGVFCALEDALVKHPLESAFFAHALLTLQQCIVHIDDKRIVTDWMSEDLMVRLSEVCEPAFCLNNPNNVPVTERVIQLFIHGLPKNGRCFQLCCDFNVHSNVMQIFLHRLYSNEGVGGDKSLKFRRQLLIFLSIFYNEAMHMNYFDSMNDYVRLLCSIVRYSFELLQSLDIPAVMAQGRTSRISPLKSDEDNPANSFHAKHGMEVMALAEEALFSMIYLFEDISSDAFKYFTNIDFSEYLILLLNLSDMFWTRFSANGACCRKSILCFFKSVFSHINSIGTCHFFAAALHREGFVVNMWNSIQKCIRVPNFISSASYTVFDSNDIDDDGSFVRCVSIAHDAFISCLMSEITLKEGEEYALKYVRMFSEQIISGHFAVRKEALMALRTLFVYGPRDTVANAVELGVIVPICDLLTVMDVEGVLGALDCIQEILLKDPSDEMRKEMKHRKCSKSYKQMMEEAGILEKLDFLMTSPNHEVFRSATDVHTTFFKSFDEDELLEADVSDHIDRIIANVICGPPPRFVDPNAPGSSNGTSFANNPDSLFASKSMPCDFEISSAELEILPFRFTFT